MLTHAFWSLVALLYIIMIGYKCLLLQPCMQTQECLNSAKTILWSSNDVFECWIKQSTSRDKQTMQCAWYNAAWMVYLYIKSQDFGWANYVAFHAIGFRNPIDAIKLLVILSIYTRWWFFVNVRKSSMQEYVDENQCKIHLMTGEQFYDTFDQTLS